MIYLINGYKVINYFKKAIFIDIFFESKYTCKLLTTSLKQLEIIISFVFVTENNKRARYFLEEDGTITFFSVLKALTTLIRKY